MEGGTPEGRRAVRRRGGGWHVVGEEGGASEGRMEGGASEGRMEGSALEVRRAVRQRGGRRAARQRGGWRAAAVFRRHCMSALYRCVI
jgi:hypothetical protein